MLEPGQTEIVMLRGLTRESRHWGTFLPCLERSSRNIRLLPFDIDGAGIFRSRLSPVKIINYIEPLREQYQLLKANRATGIILGISLGAMIAATWIEKHPGDFQGAVLINTSGNQSPLHHRLRPSAFIRLLQAAIHSNPQVKEAFIAQLLCNLADIQQITTEWDAIRSARPVRPVNFLRQLLAACRFSFPEKLPVPVLLLSGEGDKLTNPECSRIISTMTGASLISHATAGHDLTTDAPQWCADTIIQWIRGNFLRQQRKS